MPEIKDQNEPTMEEIIASIRRIIAEEDAAEPPPRANDDGILELTEMVAEDGSIVSVVAMAPVAAPATTAASPSEEPPAAAETRAEPEPPPPRPAPRTREDDLLSATSAAAAVAALSQLVSEGSDAFDDLPPAPQRTNLPPGPTLEQTVRDMLRPMLADWLDRNLPPLVEQIVRDEIARLGRAARPR
jgi:uncharacterized protein